ncbi:hypothetical protein HMPREF9371_2050 [Neisseria shayeganii 871]|uniref:Uncharacterized protein n=1 Tax=Neisseria shayeganii 871 TaxID=1032488 RepID=G4CKB0_9NEIS|nr:hypothetical protein HMPREF9371_2050 [Neisseria shayeganii 871]
MADSLADFAFLQLTYATKQRQSKTILKKACPTSLFYRYAPSKIPQRLTPYLLR